MRKKFFPCVIIFLLIILCGSAFSYNEELEREALALRVELNRLGNDGDPFEREAILRKIIKECRGTEEAERAYWDLADLYLDAFPDERRPEAIGTLELFLKDYPKSNWAPAVRSRLEEIRSK